MDIIKTYNFPFDKFSRVLRRIETLYQENNIPNYNAFCLSTCKNNIPSSRMVLLKSFSLDGFTFYTNLESQKSSEILSNPNISMLFYWKEIGIQIRILGKTSLISDSEADEYFVSRPYFSKIGAWASKQSKKMESYLDFFDRVTSYTLQYKADVPRPNYWSGFLVNPTYFEFWQEKPYRLHKRKSYEKLPKNKWKESLLYP